MALSETKLLERCVCATTQNRNEYINSLIWVRCPKHKHHRVKVIHCRVASAVLHFHGRAASQEKVMQRLSIPAGKFKKSLSPETRSHCRSQTWPALKKKRKVVKQSN